MNLNASKKLLYRQKQYFKKKPYMINIYAIVKDGHALIEAVNLGNMRCYTIQTELAHDDIVEDLAERLSIKNQKLLLAPFKPKIK